MTSSCNRPAADHAATAAEAVRALNHLTLGRRALAEPAELDQLVAELAIMAARLPQLLRQLRGWLEAEQHTGRLRSDDTTHPARIVDRAAAELTNAGHAAHDLGRALDNAHQHLAHLAATEPDHTNKPRRQDAAGGEPARALTTAGQKRWPPAGTFMATSGQVS